MKSKTKVLFLLTLLIIFLFSSVFNSRFSKNIISNNNYLEFNEKNQIQIKQSGFWDLTGNPIYIDDLATGVGAHNWTWAETQPWCSGSGNWTNPYIIENVTIDGQGSANCIEIRNSDAYFIIRNCSLYNSGSDPDNAGIYLYNFANGKLINNNCSDNNNSGIFLDDSNNSTLSGNTASNNDGDGIYLDNSNNNTFSGNNASNNNYRGIYLRYSDNNTLSGNNASNNNDRGILLSSGNNNMISGNTVNNNDHGICVGSNNNTISGNTANYNSIGIYLVWHSDNNTISGNTANYNSIGIYLDWHSDNNTISGNTVNNNDHGIYLYNSHNNKLSGNNASNNYYDGIYLGYSDNNTLSGNLMSFCGIFLSGSLAEMASHSIDKTNLVNNKPVYYYTNEIGLGSSDFTDAGQIILINCSNSIISGLNLSNSTTGIYLGYSDNNTLSGNTANNNNRNGIYLLYSNNNTISGNTARNNIHYGIYLFNSHNNTISGNTANYNSVGIYLDWHSDNNTLSGNTANNNTYGIYLYYCVNNTISENLMNFCGIFLFGSLAEMASNSIEVTNLVNNKPVYYYVNEIGLESSNFSNAGQIILVNCNNSIISGLDSSGISLYYCVNNTISGNTASNNYVVGISLYYCVNNTISGNTISNNYAVGIFLMYSNNNTISGNTISNNSNGIWLEASNNNNIFLNNFVNNEINAEDNGINNTWDDGTIGNYWSDYAGVDANDDGIGDTPYLVPGTAGSQDNFPIYDNIAPVITIISPLSNSVFGLDAPNYNISIDELNLDTIWYTLDGGITNYTITDLTGIFNQAAWEALSEGSLTIRFYANDTGGNIGSAAVTIEKDISAPIITIIFPLHDSVFGLDAPNYNISIDELNLDTIWYTLDGGITNYTITDLTGIFNQAAWEALSEGSLTIRFYANDTAGNIGFIDVEVIIELPEDVDDLPIISFGNYYILFTFITILSFIILEKRKKK